MSRIINPGERIRMQGFTLIELLVVVAIIGLLASIIVTAVTVSRLKARDARRISDLRQVKAGFDLYLTEGGGYPPGSAWVTGAVITCTQATIRVPVDPLSPTYNYTYAPLGTGIVSTQCSGSPTVFSRYRVDFYVENKAASYYMNEDANVFDSAGNPVAWDSLLQ